tara:strand:+ start:1259 stop:1609 length:351 start_codon:yes stop_codon:yes gene_type:complete
VPVERGWKPDKFVVRHYRRGDLLDGEAFVLVPERDPAAVPAIVSYANATPDPELADRLRAWLTDLGHAAIADPVTPPTNDRLPGWIATLGDAVRSGSMDPEVALLRLAALVRQGEG